MSKHQEHQDPNGLDDRFADWVDGRLDEQTRRELEAELAQDPELRRQAEEYRATVQLVQGHLAEARTDEEPPADLVGSVLERVRRERAPLFRLVPLVASLATAAALVLMVVLFNQPSGRTPPKEVAKHEVGDVEVEEAEEEEVMDKSDDRALKKDVPRPVTKSAKSAEPAKPDTTIDTLDELKAGAEARKQTAEGKRVAKVNEGLPADPAPSKAPAPEAPAQRARPGAGAEQRLDVRARRHLPQVRQLQELQRIATLVFPPAPRQEQDEDLERDKFAQGRPRLKRVAERSKKNKAADAKPMAQPQAQVPVVVVQLAGTQVAGGKSGGRAELHKEQQQVGQGFLGYLQQQPKTWSVGNQIFKQARTEDLSRALATLSRPQTGGGAAGALGRALVRPGDQVLKVHGTSQEVEKLFQQLKDFLGKPDPQVVVQETPVVQLPTALGRFGARDYGEKQRAAEEMSFYLVLRQAPPTMRPRAGRR